LRAAFLGHGVRNLEEIAGSVICAEHSHDILKIEGAGTASAEDGYLVTALVNGAVAVKAF
jgi:hypothetical protein